MINWTLGIVVNISPEYVDSEWLAKYFKVSSFFQIVWSFVVIVSLYLIRFALCLHTHIYIELYLYSLNVIFATFGVMIKSTIFVTKQQFQELNVCFVLSIKFCEIITNGTNFGYETKPKQINVECRINIYT